MFGLSLVFAILFSPQFNFFSSVRNFLFYRAEINPPWLKAVRFLQ